MLSKLLPILLLVLGTGAGVGAGIFLAPDEGTEAHASPEPKDDHDEEAGDSAKFVKLNNQFVVPILQQDRVAALVVVSLSLETSVAMSDRVFEREPKLRDAFLRVLFDHANMGGFNGAFTKPGTLDVLRSSLTDVARKEMGENVRAVLITDISRQDT